MLLDFITTNAKLRQTLKNLAPDLFKQVGTKLVYIESYGNFLKGMPGIHVGLSAIWP